MKLILCQRGNVRGATAAAVLRDCYGEVDVFAIGVDTMTPCFLSHLSGDVKVWIMGDASVAVKFAAMHPQIAYTHFDIGADHWLAPMHPDLVRRIVRELQAHGYTETSPVYGTADNYINANAIRWNELHLV